LFGTSKEGKPICLLLDFVVDRIPWQVWPTRIRLLSNIMAVVVLIGAVATIPVSIVEWMMFA
jgi:hypothetical protein